MGRWMIGIGVATLVAGLVPLVGSTPSVSWALVGGGLTLAVVGLPILSAEQRVLWRGERDRFREATATFMRLLGQADQSLRLGWLESLRLLPWPKVDVSTPPLGWRDALPPPSHNQTIMLELLDGVYGPARVGGSSVLSQEDFDRFDTARRTMKNIADEWGRRKQPGFDSFLRQLRVPLHAQVLTVLAYAEIVLAQRLRSTSMERDALFQLGHRIGIDRSVTAANRIDGARPGEF